MSSKQIVIYGGLVYLLSWLLQLGAIFLTEGIDTEKAEGWLVAAMLMPAIVTLVFLVLDKSLRAKIWWKPNLSIVPAAGLAVFVPVLIAFAVLVILEAMGYGSSGWFTFAPSGASISGGPWVLGLGNQSWTLFLCNILLTALVFSLINAIPAAGEEFAWRGFLQGILIEKMGVTKGIVLLGLIWSFWHLPALLAGYNHPETPVLGSFLISPIELIGISFFMAWLTLSSRSFIPAAIAHGAGNSIQEGVIANIGLSIPQLYEHLLTMALTVATGLLFWALLCRRK